MRRGRRQDYALGKVTIPGSRHHVALLAALDPLPAPKAAKSEPALIPLDYYPCIVPFMIDFNILLGNVLIYGVFLLQVLQNDRRGDAFSVSLCEVRFVDHYLHFSLLVLPLFMWFRLSQTARADGHIIQSLFSITCVRCKQLPCHSFGFGIERQISFRARVRPDIRWQ